MRRYLLNYETYYLLTTSCVSFPLSLFQFPVSILCFKTRQKTIRYDWSTCPSGHNEVLHTARRRTIPYKSNQIQNNGYSYKQNFLVAKAFLVQAGNSQSFALFKFQSLGTIRIFWACFILKKSFMSCLVCVF